jgi:hypothetical protein
MYKYKVNHFFAERLLGGSTPTAICTILLHQEAKLEIPDGIRSEFGSDQSFLPKTPDSRSEV